MFWKLLKRLIMKVNIMKKKSIDIKIIYSDDTNKQVIEVDKYIKFIRHLINIFKEQELTGI